MKKPGFDSRGTKFEEQKKVLSFPKNLWRGNFVFIFRGNKNRPDSPRENLWVVVCMCAAQMGFVHCSLARLVYVFYIHIKPTSIHTTLWMWTWMRGWQWEQWTTANNLFGVHVHGCMYVLGWNWMENAVDQTTIESSLLYIVYAGTRASLFWVKLHKNTQTHTTATKGGYVWMEKLDVSAFVCSIENGFLIEETVRPRVRGQLKHTHKKHFTSINAAA